MAAIFRKTAMVTSLALMACTARAADCEISRAQYQALTSGMSYEDVVHVLGCEGEELSSSDMAGFHTVMYMWKGRSLGANMNAMFQNDELMNKAQFGLQ